MTTDQKPPEEVKVTASDAIGALGLAFKFLSLLERILPAFLVSWANHLKAQNKELRSEAKLAEIKLDVMEKKHAAEKDALLKKPIDVVNNFLSK